jgi:hypothetical protein
MARFDRLKLLITHAAVEFQLPFLTAALNKVCPLGGIKPVNSARHWHLGHLQNKHLLFA